MKWGMFICWSFSTFSGREWTPTKDKGPEYFKVTGCDTDQWARTAKEARMGYILFLTKHHDGFCLWDTATTEKKVTNSPLGVDVIAKLRKSCDKYGIKLAFYFSEGDWNWPGAIDGRGSRGGSNPEVKKAQLKELCTQYGPIEFYWMDHAVKDGGLSHRETVDWVHKFQPDCFVGFNHGEPAGRLCIRERGRPGPIGDANATKYNKKAEASHKGYEVAEFTYPILPSHKGGAQWFYSLPKHDDLCHPARKLIGDYQGALRYGNIFSIDVGPNYAGRLRDIDVKTLREVGEMIGKLQPPSSPRPPSLASGRPASASSQWSPEYDAAKAFDGDEATRWGAKGGLRRAWLQVDLGAETLIGSAEVCELAFPRTQEFVIECRSGPEDTWRELARGIELGYRAELTFPPVRARYVRLRILKASEVPTIEEFRVYGPKAEKR
jgi:alpha-L-fucosidase